MKTEREIQIDIISDFKKLISWLEEMLQNLAIAQARTLRKKPF